MPGNAETEELTAFVRRYAAVNAATGQVSDGYFRVDGGKTRGKAKKCAALVDWNSDPDKVLIELKRRVDQARADHAVVIVRAMPRGESHAAESLPFEGDPEPTIGGDDEVDIPKGANAAAEALGIVAIQTDRRVGMLVESLLRMAEERTQVEVERALYAYHAMAVAGSGNSAMFAKAIETVGPALAESLPAVLAILAQAASGAPIKPPEPKAEPKTTAEKVTAHVATMLTTAAELQAAILADPPGAQACLPELAKLRELVTRFAPLVGLRVAPEPAAE